LRALRKAGAAVTETRIVLRTRPFQHQVREAEAEERERDA
jgi:hypothetical protein